MDETVVNYNSTDTDDGLPWEVNRARCVFCSHEFVAVTHWPTIRRDLECPKCEQLSAVSMELLDE